MLFDKINKMIIKNLKERGINNNRTLLVSKIIFIIILSINILSIYFVEILTTNISSIYGDSNNHMIVDTYIYTSTSALETEAQQTTSELLFERYESEGKKLVNENVKLIIYNDNSCTGYIDKKYIEENYIGEIEENIKIIGWSIYTATPDDQLLISAQLDWESESDSNGMLRGLGIYENAGTIQEGIYVNLTDEGLIIDIESDDLPFDLNDIKYIELQNIYEYID